MAYLERAIRGCRYTGGTGLTLFSDDTEYTTTETVDTSDTPYIAKDEKIRFAIPFFAVGDFNIDLYVKKSGTYGVYYSVFRNEIDRDHLIMNGSSTATSYSEKLDTNNQLLPGDIIYVCIAVGGADTTGYLKDFKLQADLVREATKYGNW